MEPVSAGAQLTPTVVVVVFAIAWELVSAGGLGIIDPRGYRAVYQAVWWGAPVMLVIAGVVAAVSSACGIATAAAALAIVLAGACFVFPLRTAEKRSVNDPAPVRRATDRNRRRRLPLLILSAALAITASLIGRVP